MASRILHNANSAIESRLDELAGAVETRLDCDVLALLGPILFGVDSVVRDAIENRKRRKRRLAIVLETGGGYIEVAQRIADTMRRHYRHVEFIVPNQAMSAGTVLVMSGDVIRMDYYSVLGPIDPQVQRPGSAHLIPALGYLIQFNRLMEKANNGQLSSAEMVLLVQKYDPAELYAFEQQRELSISLLKEWLVKYKFKNWKKTKTRRRTVTRAMRVERAASIASILNDTDRWHTHGRGITMPLLKRLLKLEIDDFGKDRDLNHCIREYHKLLVDYSGRRGHPGVIHLRGHYTPFMVLTHG